MAYNEKYYNNRAVRGSIRTTDNFGYSIDGTLGDWEIIGGETELYVLNHSNNKKYKLSMEEI